MANIVAVQQVACGGRRHKLLLMDDGRLVMKHHSRKSVAVFGYLTDDQTECEKVFAFVTNPVGALISYVRFNGAFRKHLAKIVALRQRRTCPRKWDTDDDMIARGHKRMCHPRLEGRIPERQPSESVLSYGRRLLHHVICREHARWPSSMRTKMALQFCDNDMAYINGAESWFYSAHIPANWYRTVYIKTKAAFTVDGELILRISDMAGERQQYHANVITKQGVYRSMNAVIARQDDGWKVTRYEL
jgi:hypothetical protein